MEHENQSNFKHQQYGVYGRIKKVITFINESSPSARPINDPKESKPAPIEFDHSRFSKTKTNQPGAKKNEQGRNDRFADYIKRAKMKMWRSMTVVGGSGGGSSSSSSDGGKGMSKLESINKKTSAYIDSAKVKMRTASIVGFGKKRN